MSDRKKKHEAIVKASYRLMEAYRELAKDFIQTGHDSHAADALEKAMKIQKVLRGQL